MDLKSLNPEQWSSLEPVLSQLVKADVSSVAALEGWLQDWSQLCDHVDEVSAQLYVNMTCHTDNPEFEKRYIAFMSEVLPHYKEWSQKLREKYVESPAHKQLPKDKYFIVNRSFEQQVKLFRKENLQIDVECDKLEQQYQKLMGELSVDYDGKTQTLYQMAKYQEMTDRAVRETTWRLVADKMLTVAPQFEDIYDKLVAHRHQIAVNAGFANYRDFAFAARERFDYTPQDCADFHAAVEKHLVPLARKLAKERKQKLGVDILRPWDMGVDAEGRAPLKPFKNSDELLQKCRSIFSKVHPEFVQTIDAMQENGMFDLDNRPGKAPGGYQHSFELRRLPFIFMNATGMQSDVETLLHEGGHAIHYWASRNQSLAFDRHAPIEFCEVASMGMEFLAGQYLEEFYSKEDANRARKDHLEHVLWVFNWVATIDAFQHWVYTHPKHSREERADFWDSLMQRFGGGEEWVGLEANRRGRWFRQSHLFTSPFYYIEYAIAQIGALQLWQQDLKDQKTAVANYRNALSLAGTKTIPELFAAGQLKFGFNESVIAPLAKTISDHLS
ncbi:MAG: peptidase M3 [Deltaproteobacteria bacterium CG11_big_fil_rev_8_21_14_0_20_47_16]|nr:MAG: peptidase M3 [Deltaproteobacteria bacterium CG11_big_fil_rev_8_21_14_0_20_47_16]